MPRPRVRKALLVALALSMLLHAAWTLWPADPTNVPGDTVLTVTLAEMPPPPVPVLEPVPAPAAKRARPRTPRRAAPPAPATPTVAPDSTAPGGDASTDVVEGPAPAPRDEPSVTAATSFGICAPSDGWM